MTPEDRHLDYARHLFMTSFDETPTALHGQCSCSLDIREPLDSSWLNLHAFNAFLAFSILCQNLQQSRK